MEAVILAGGLGTRLRSVVSELPKCMAPVAGKPFLWHLLRYLSSHGVTRVVLSVGYLREVIFDWIDKNGAQFPFEYDYAIEEQPLGTGGGIRLALSKCREEQVLVFNGDTFFDVNIDELVKFHGRCGAPISLALKPMENFDRYGAVELDGSYVTAFREKCPCATGVINGGVYCISRSLMDLSALPEKFSFETAVLERLADARRVCGFPQQGYFIDIGIPEDYARAQREMSPLDGIDITPYDTILLDRDGVINRQRVGDYVKCPAEFEFLPGVLDILPRWAAKCKHIFIVTNQRGVTKGLMTEADLHEVHNWMCERIAAAGGRIDKVYYCTALTCEEDIRRKPGVGMYLDICRDYPEVASGRTLMIGDMASDEEFAANCKIDFHKVG